MVKKKAKSKTTKKTKTVKPTKSKKKKIIFTTGKRKTAVARATIREGSGGIKINSIPLELYTPEFARMKIEETIILASDYVDLDKLNISVNSHGGGRAGQTDAIASSIARGLVELTESDELLEKYVKHDRTVITGDYRLKETHKPSQSSQGARHKRQKSYR